MNDLISKEKLIRSITDYLFNNLNIDTLGSDLRDLIETQQLKFPCDIGTDVYFIPSKTNYELNVLNKYDYLNRVYHQKIERITITPNCWYVECDKDIEYGTDKILTEHQFGVTWFLSQNEAEKMLNSYASK